jgi:hypothetical protein
MKFSFKDLKFILSESVDYNASLQTPLTRNLESMIKSVSQLSVNERLLLIEAITQSIRKSNLIAS